MGTVCRVMEELTECQVQRLALSKGLNHDWLEGRGEPAPPLPSSSLEFKALKNHLQGQLANPGITRTCDASEGAGTYAVARVAKIRAIEGIKDLRPNLNFIALAEGEVLKKSHVPSH